MSAGEINVNVSVGVTLDGTVDPGGSDTSHLQQSATPPKPRVWTVFTALAVALAAVLVSQIAAVAVLALWLVSQGMAPERLATDLMTRLMTPWVFIALGLASQAVMLGTALAAAKLSPVPLVERIGLGRPTLPVAGHAVVALGSWLPLAVSLGLATAISQVIPPDPSVAKLYEQMTWAAALPFLLFISLAPGFCEEVLFRGYVQRRLLERWSPWTAIAVTSLLFAIFHVTPHGFAVAFPLGVWLGWLAWRTGSVWPGVVCHAFVNGSWNVFQLGVRLAGLPAEPPTYALALVGLLAVTGFIASLWLVRASRVATPSAAAIRL